jgi:hypothetical protein
MERDYKQFDIDKEIAPEPLARIKKTIDAIIDGGYGSSESLNDRVHVAYCICKDLEIMYYRGLAAGIQQASKEWKEMVEREVPSTLGRAGRITEKS